LIEQNDIIDDHLSGKQKSNKISFKFCSIFVLTVFIGFYFRLNHWPGATILMLLGWSILCGYLIAKTFFLKKIGQIILTNSISILISFLVINSYDYFNYTCTYSSLVIISFTVTFIFGYRIKKYNQRIQNE